MPMPPAPTRSGRFLTALAGALVVALAPATAASAAPTVEVDCDSGGGVIMCTTQYAAQAPATVQWFVQGVHKPAYDGSSSLRVGCSIGTAYTV